MRHSYESSSSLQALVRVPLTLARAKDYELQMPPDLRTRELGTRAYRKAVVVFMIRDPNSDYKSKKGAGLGSHNPHMYLDSYAINYPNQSPPLRTLIPEDALLELEANLQPSG
eukprot:5408081-Prymnesium_polylepis.1